MSFRVSVDIGGTFTDCVVANANGGLGVYKCFSTPGQFERGFLDVLTLAASHHGLSLREFLSRTESIVHGTTVSTNALVEGKSARVGFICNEGHPDILTFREAPRKRAFNWRLDYPEPFVSRALTCEVRGRIDAQGNEVEPLAEVDVKAAASHFRNAGAEAVAVCLLWSIVNPEHERRVREILRHELPDAPITLSHELNPIPREYRRAISAVIDAALQPIVSAYVGSLEQALHEAGYTRGLLVANCVGGMMPAEEVVAKPIYSVMSGPTLAPIAALDLTAERDVIVTDMGGTTFDVSAIRDRLVVITPEALILPHDLLGLPKVDVRSIGAGGGSIAWVDPGGLLRVGPHSAGAIPGPACYGRGGKEATVTDANVVLGIIDPDYFLGGRVKLDRAAGEAAVGRIATRLGLPLVETAYAIHTTCNHGMVTAIEDVTVNEGIDPHASFLVAGGGATPCHIGEIARVLGIRRFMIPKVCAALSAFGGLISDLRWEAVASRLTDHRRFALKAINDMLASLAARCTDFLERAGVAPEHRRLEYSYRGRYQYQSWEIEVPFMPANGTLRLQDVDGLAASFHEMHERIYGIKDEDDLVEFTTWKVVAVGANGTAVDGFAEPHAGRTELHSRSMRPVYLRSLGGMVDVPVYSGAGLKVGERIEGPAVVEEATTTILLLPGMRAEVDASGNYMVAT